ncbi:MAG: hypothetical protein ACRC62_37730 [Microcoleus sp.]
MLESWIETTQGWIALKPVVLERLPALEEMLMLLRALGYTDERLALKILKLHDRLDPVELSMIRLEWFEDWPSLFQEGGYIDQINAAIAPPSKDGDEDEVPPWASGNYVDDWVSDLTYFLGDYRQARAFVRENSLQTTMNVLRRLKDLHKGAKGREDEANKELYWKNLHLINFGEEDD